MKYEGIIDLLKNEIQNVAFQNLASAPGTPVSGQFYFDTTLDKFGFYDGTTWQYPSEANLSTYLSAASAAANSGQVWVSAGADRTTSAFTGTIGALLKLDTNNVLTSATAGTDYVTAASTNTFTNKTFDANGTGNSLSNVEVADFAGSAIVTELEGIGSNDNDTTIPTSAAVKDYVDSAVGSGATKYAATVGDGSTTAIAVTHSLGSKDVVVSTRYVSNDEAFIVDWTATSTSAITLNFAVAPATNTVRVTVIG